MAQKEVDECSKFVNGKFEWDSITCEIIFISYESATGEMPQILTKTATTKKHASLKLETSNTNDKYIEFKDDLNLSDKNTFQKRFRRTVEWPNSNAILLQDVKDVVLYTANPTKLTSEFIMLLHLPETDDLLRAGIIYFHFYFQTWNELKNRKEELERKIFQPNVKNYACKDLSDLRVILAVKYFSLLEDYRNKNKSSSADGGQRLCEMVIQFSKRVFWFALNKPPLNLIEQEVDRLFRSSHYNIFEHKHLLQNKYVQIFTADQKRILRGHTDFLQRRLTAMSPLGKELIYGFHDHRLLLVGHLEFPPFDDRLRYMEKLYLLPEEEFEKNNICIGVLGMNRDNFDVLLKQIIHKPKTDTEEKSVKELVFKMEIPPYIENSSIPWRYSTKPPTLKRNCRKKLLIQQCKKWLYHIRTDTDYQNENMGSVTSY